MSVWNRVFEVARSQWDSLDGSILLVGCAAGLFVVWACVSRLRSTLDMRRWRAAVDLYAERQLLDSANQISKNRAGTCA